MKKNVLRESKAVHMVGIGGSGMSGLAGLLMKQGKHITGSDKEYSATTEKLEKDGIIVARGQAPAGAAWVSRGHRKENLAAMPSRGHRQGASSASVDLLIHSLAIPASNPEIVEAKRRKIPILSYPAAVGELSKDFFTIAVCGTHGKTTITAMISKVLVENNFDPTVIVGAQLKELGHNNFRLGKSKLLVLEACEYKRAFLNYHPKIILIHTLDPDHLDYYHNFEDYLDAFREFVIKLPVDGYFFGNLDDQDVHSVMQTLQAKKFPSHNTFTYATKYPSANFYLKEDKIIQRNRRVGQLNLKIPGTHNRTNALAAFAVCSTLGIAPQDILRSLNHYTGASRRFELKGKIGRTTVIDDYAHHPVEIEATLQAAREQFPKEKICVVFQPHQYNRTKNLIKEFGTAFKKADAVLIPNIYEVRDSLEDVQAVSAARLAEEIRKNQKKGIVRHTESIEKTVNYLKEHAKNYDVILTMGAGDVWKVAESLVTAQRS